MAMSFELNDGFVETMLLKEVKNHLLSKPVFLSHKYFIQPLESYYDQMMLKLFSCNFLNMM